jgi:ribosomal protein S6--L-glutamate ligase
MSPGARLRVTILSGKRDTFSVRRLRAAFRALGHPVEVVDPFACAVSFDHASGQVLRGKTPLETDLVIPRLSARSATPYCLAILRQLEANGAVALNGAGAIDVARDKLRTLQTLAPLGVPVPRTLVLANRAQLRAALPLIGGLPVVVKLIHGTQGVGVMIADSDDSIRTLLDTLWSLRTDTIVQRFVRESRGRDLRAFVVGDEVVAAMRRTAAPGEFRANLHRGGQALAVELDEATQRIAVRASRALGLEMAGVDLIEANEGSLVMEVNSSPSLEGIEKATGLDIARRITDHATRLVLARRSR